MIKNKKADAPVTILVLGVVVICILAIVSFYFSYQNVKKGFRSLDVVEEAVLVKEKLGFYQNLGLSKEESEKLIDIRSDILGSYVYTERSPIYVKYYIP